MHRNLKKATLVLPLLLILTFGLAACGGTSAPANAPANEVDMGAANFVQTSRTITAGDRIHFVAEQGGATHVLCTGKDGACDAGATGPQDLSGQGFTIQPGESHDVQFYNAGVYRITCPIHPSMNLVVTVR
jgi:plastocyanin